MKCFLVECGLKAPVEFPVHDAVFEVFLHYCFFIRVCFCLRCFGCRRDIKGWVHVRVLLGRVRMQRFEWRKTVGLIRIFMRYSIETVHWRVILCRGRNHWRYRRRETRHGRRTRRKVDLCSVLRDQEVVPAQFVPQRIQRWLVCVFYRFRSLPDKGPPKNLPITRTGPVCVAVLYFRDCCLNSNTPFLGYADRLRSFLGASMQLSAIPIETQREQGRFSSHFLHDFRQLTHATLT
jgi:hypothetical protein